MWKSRNYFRTEGVANRQYDHRVTLSFGQSDTLLGGFAATTILLYTPSDPIYWAHCPLMRELKNNYKLKTPWISLK